MEIRPVSPHLQIYRWGISSFLSITHRISGIALGGFLLWVSSFLYVVSAGEGYFQQWILWHQMPIGQSLIYVWIFILAYHTLGGFRHLLWDIGIGFSLPKFSMPKFTPFSLNLGLSFILLITIFLFCFIDWWLR